MAYAQEMPVRAVPEESRRLRGRALIVVVASLLLALFLAILDQTIVDTALPRIIGELQGFERYTWVITAYLLTSTAMIPITAKLSDQFGRKGWLIGGMVLFLLSSVLAGAAQTMDQLIVCRGLQGLGSGMIQALVVTVVGDIFPGAERARWQGFSAGTYALASVVGPAIGGIIVDHVSWRWVFYINVPFGALALLMLMLQLPVDISPRSTQEHGWDAVRRVDMLGAFTAASATVCLLLGLTWGGQAYPWRSSLVIGVLAGAGMLFLLFVVIERLVDEPILPLSLLRNRVFAAGTLLALTTNMALLALVVYLPLFIQGVLGQPATNSGVAITPLTIAVTISAVAGGLAISRTGRYRWVVIVGAMFMTFGVFLMTRMTASSSWLIVTRNMIVVGLGVGMIQPSLTLAVQNAIPRMQLGVGTGALTYLRSMGSTLGVAVIGAVVNSTFASHLAEHLPAAARQLPAQMLAAATSQQVLVNAAYRRELVSRVVQGAVERETPILVTRQAASIPPGPHRDQMLAALTVQIQRAIAQHTVALLHQIFMATRLTLALAIHNAFIVSLVICEVVLMLAFFLKDVPLKRHAEQALVGEDGEKGQEEVTPAHR
jgi:EmrB/QacA subfamily drug resistance transporter